LRPTTLFIMGSPIRRERAILVGSGAKPGVNSLQGNRRGGKRKAA